MKITMQMALVVLLSLSTSAFAQSGSDALAQAQVLIDKQSPEGAIELLDGYLKKNKKSAPGYLARSTAQFILGDLEAGRQDLERALELDPALRQGWLNLGGLQLAEEDPTAALASFERAQTLDPEAGDNDLNLGTVKLLLGRAQEAADHFAAHLEQQREPAEASFLIAKNYALAGYQEEAIDSLERAIVNDEQYRLAARTDPVFDPLRPLQGFLRLLETDSFRPAPNDHVHRAQLDVTYEIGRGIALAAVIDALRALKIPFDSRIEVTPSWSIVHAEIRIKVSAAGPRNTDLELVAPSARYTPQQWTTTSKGLVDQIRWQLAPKIPG